MNVDEMPNPANPPRPMVDPDADSNERTIAVFMHLLSLGNYLGILLVPLIVQIVLWRVKKDDSPFLDDHGREAVNFHLSLIVWSFLVALLSIVCVGVLLIPVLIVLSIVAPIVMAVRANRGEYVRYPMTIRFV